MSAANKCPKTLGRFTKVHDANNRSGDNIFSYSYLDPAFEPEVVYYFGKGFPNDKTKSKFHIRNDYLAKVTKVFGDLSQPIPEQWKQVNKHGTKVKIGYDGWYYDKYGKFRSVVNARSFDISYAPSGAGGASHGIFEILRIINQVAHAIKYRDLYQRVSGDAKSIDEAWELLKSVAPQLPEFIKTNGKILADICNCLSDNRMPITNSSEPWNPYSRKAYSIMIYQLARDIFHNKKAFIYEDFIPYEVVYDDIPTVDETGYNRYNTLDHEGYGVRQHLEPQEVRKATCPETKTAVEEFQKLLPGDGIKFTPPGTIK